MGVEHSNKKFVYVEAESDVRIMPVKGPPKDGINNLAVLLHPPIRSTIGFLIALKLIDSTSASLDVC